MIEVRGLAKSFEVASPGRGRGWGWATSLRARANGGTAVSAPSPRVHAVRDVSFDAPNGRITGLLGPNGAGKTTTLRMLAALITPEAGTMRVDGIDVVARPREVLARMGVLSDSLSLDQGLVVHRGKSHHLSAAALIRGHVCDLVALGKRS